MRFRGIAGTFLPILLFFVVFSPWGMGDEEGKESGEKRTLPTPEEETRLKSDPFFQSFANAFDDVMREECPDWKKSPAPEGESDREARSTNDSLPPQISEVERDRLFAFFQTERKRLDSALIDALIYQNAIGHKARRSFRFLRNSVGEFRRVDQVGDFDMTRGEFLRTGSPNDVAIEGEGFFQVVLRDSRRDEGTDSTPSRFYTRAGNFQKDEKGAFFLPAPETGNADQEETTPLRYYLDPPVDSIGDIPIFRFMSPERLTSADGIFFQPTEMSGPPRATPTSSPVDSEDSDPSTLGNAPFVSEKTTLRVGFLERSNGSPELIQEEKTRLSEWNFILLPLLPN